MFNDIAVIAGSGKLPFKIASYLKKFNANFIILAIKGYSKINLYKNFKTYSLRMGEGHKAIKILKENKIKNILAESNRACECGSNGIQHAIVRLFVPREKRNLDPYDVV